ncbi:hypothetical protein EV127DRAFT_472140 [Xylaria flabelliformis]|nr:hypothetical protein EV127DRAFT_472140 [Xylaria flabelliformis]
MNNLPQEIVDHVVSFIPLRYVAPFATVSRKFQWAVERRTFSNIYIKTTEENIDEFERIWSPRRRSHLRFLVITLIVSRFCPQDLPKSYGYSQVDMEATLAPLRRLWNLLSSAWREMDLNGGNVEFALWNIPNPEHESKFLQHYPFPPLDLTTGAESFPALPFVRKFDIVGGSYYLHPRTPVVLVSSMPNLESVSWKIEEAPRGWGRYYSIDKHWRDELIHTIKTSYLPDSVKDFYYELPRPFDLRITQALPKFIENGTPDPLSRAMRELTRHCEDITLKGSFGPSLFDPPISAPEEEEQPCWQNTTRLRVRMAISCPDGSWLFKPQGRFRNDNLHDGLLNCTQLPPGYGDTEQEQEAAFQYFKNHPEALDIPRYPPERTFDVVPDDEKLNTFLIAFARCCARMPTLKIARFEIGDYWWYARLMCDWPIVVCVAPFCDSDDYTWNKMYPSSSWVVYLRVGSWRPSGATFAAFENIGAERSGRPSIIEFL